jgi:hypothetical protein
MGRDVRQPPEREAGRALSLPGVYPNEQLRPERNYRGQMADEVARPEFQFGCAACGNCGYSIFFDASVTGLWFEHLGGGRTPTTEGENPPE